VNGPQRTSTLVKSQVLREGQKVPGVDEDFVRVCPLNVSKHPVSRFKRTSQRGGRVLRDDTGELRTQDKWEFRSSLVLPLGLQDLRNEI